MNTFDDIEQAGPYDHLSKDYIQCGHYDPNNRSNDTNDTECYRPATGAFVVLDMQFLDSGDLESGPIVSQYEQYTTVWHCKEHAMEDYHEAVNCGAEVLFSFDLPATVHIHDKETRKTTGIVAYNPITGGVVTP